MADVPQAAASRSLSRSLCFITQDREITAWEGVTLLLLYAAFLLNLVL